MREHHSVLLLRVRPKSIGGYFRSHVYAPFSVDRMFSFNLQLLSQRFALMVGYCI
jgi:hypothetical protein